MKSLRKLLLVATLAALFSNRQQAAPPIEFPGATIAQSGTGITRLRVLRQSEDGTEVVLTMDYNYDGFAGTTAVILPVIKKKGQPGVSGWFGCDPAVVPQGRGPISIKVKYFNDETGVPPQFTSDLVDVLILNSGRTAKIGGTTAPKTITWGNTRAPKPTLPAPVVVNPKAEALAAAARAVDAAHRAAEAEAKSKAEAETRNQQLAARKAQEEQKAGEEAEAAKAAQAKAEAGKQARVKAEEELKRLEAARVEADNNSGKEALPVDSSLKTRIANLDVVNRSFDRSQMTIGVEFEYKDSLQQPMLGVDVLRKGEPAARGFFEAQTAEIAKSRRNFVLVPVKFHPPKPEDEAYDAFATDEVMVYLQDASNGRHNLLPASLLLSWHSPQARKREASPEAGAALQIEWIKQNDLFSGYVAVKYSMASASSQLRLLLFDSSNLKSIEWFATPELVLNAGSGLELMKFAVRRDASSPVDIIKTDMIQIDLLDSAGKALATVSTNTPLTWAKPK